MSEPSQKTRNHTIGDAFGKRLNSAFVFVGASLFLSCVTVAVFHELAMQPDGLLVGVHANGRNDLTLQFLRFRDTPAELAGQSEELQIGWDRHLGLGMPVHGNPQMALFYPPNWVCFAFGATSTISWLLVAHMFFAGLGTWALARSARLSSVSCLFAGAVAVAAPYCVAHLAEGHVAQICAVAWVPWVLFSYERFLASDGRHWKSVSFCLAMSFLAGHVQEPYYLALLLSGAVVLSALTRMRKGEAGAGSLLAHWTIAGVVTMALVAVDLIPVYLNSLGTGRGTRLPLEQAGAGLQLANLRQLINPFALGEPGEANAAESFYWTRLLYFGVVSLILAIIGTLVAFRRPFTRRVTLLVAVGFVFALGTITPLYEVCWRFVPMIGSFRIPSRVLFICSYGVAVLAAIGLDSLITKSPDTPENAGDPDSPPTVSLLRSVLGLAILVGAVAELGWHTRRIVEVANPVALRENSEISQFLAEHSEEHRVQTTHNLYSDREALRDGVQKLRGYEPVVQVRLAWLLDALSSGPDDRIDFGGFRETELNALNQNVADLAGVRYLLTSQRQEPIEGWQLVRSGTVPPLIHLADEKPGPVGFGIYENLDVMPRAFVIGNVVETSGVDQQSAIAGLERLDPRGAVMLERDVLPAGPRAEFAAAEIVESLPERVTVNASLDAPGYLILTDLFHPGWSASIDGEPADILPANLAFRGVPLPPGDHEVVFRFECPGQKPALFLSGVMLALLIPAGIVSSVRERRRSKSEASPINES